MRKDNPNVQYFKTETDVSNQNLIDDFFKKFERPFHRKVIKWKKNGVTGYFLRKQKLCMQNLTKVWKQPPIVILQLAIFYNRFILRLWQRIIRRTDQGV